jgi:hypothetical protein
MNFQTEPKSLRPNRASHEKTDAKLGFSVKNSRTRRNIGLADNETERSRGLRARKSIEHGYNEMEQKLQA